MAVSMIGPKFYAWDRNGKPLAFGKLYTYEARTNVPKPTYQSEDQVVENTNPVILNGEGYANVYLSGSYKMVLKDDKENEIWSSDPVSSNVAEEWSNCASASYLSPSSLKAVGNVTDHYTSGRKVRLDSNLPDYEYAVIESASYSAGETTIILTEPVVRTGLEKICVSIVGPNSSFSFDDSKKSHGDYDSYTCQSVSEMVSGLASGGGEFSYKENYILKTASYYSKAECLSLGITYPDGGSARYIVIAGTGIVADNVKYIQLDNDLVAELLDKPTFENAGVVPNYIDSTNKGYDNNLRLVALNEAAEKFGSLNMPTGKFYSTLPLRFTVDVKGSVGAEFYVEPPASLVPLLAFGPGVIAKKVTVYPSETDATKTFIPNEFESVFGSEFEYSTNSGGLTGEGDNVIMDCQALSMDRAARGDGDDITYVRGKYQGANWGASIYARSRITFSGTLIIGGNVGGMGMPSCKHVTVCNGATVYNPNGTGINTGGSNAEGFNAEDVNVVGVNVYARDCINLENGCVGANISGYNIQKQRY